MTVYWFLIIVTFFLHLLFMYLYLGGQISIGSYRKGINSPDIEFAREKVERKTIAAFFVFYISLLCLRDRSVGIDTAKYIALYFERFKYMNIKAVLQSTGDELGFSLFSKIISAATKSSQIYLTTIALVSVIPILCLYRNECKDALLCCSFFLISLLFETFFSALRQGIAIGLAVPAYYYTKQNKIIPFLFFVFLATTFHLSAFIIVLMYPLYHAKITWRWLWGVVPIMVLLYRYNDIVFNNVLTNLGGKYADKYLIYGYNATGQYGLLVLFVMISIYCFVVLDESQASKDDIGLRNILLLATALQLFAPLHVLASRMNYYFILFIPIALTRANYNCKKAFWQIAQVARVIMIAYFILYFFFMKGDALQIMNYQFCF